MQKWKWNWIRLKHLNQARRFAYCCRPCFQKIRKFIKSDLQKLIPVKYSPNVHTIEKIKKPIGEKKDLMKPRYTLSYQGKLINSQRKTQTFYGSELQRANKISPDDILTQKDAMKLN